jgi:ATP-binding cassette subfamily B protein
MPAPKKKSNFYWFVSNYKPYKALLAANMIASVAAAAFALVWPLGVRHITNNILATGAADATPEILYTCLLMAAAITMQTCAGVFNDWMGHVMGAKIERDLRAKLFAHNMPNMRR